MKVTLQVLLNSGVTISTSREVKTFIDVGMFGRKVVDWANQIKKIAPDLAGDKVEDARILKGESDTTARPARKRNRKGKAAGAEAPGMSSSHDETGHVCAGPEF